KVQTNLAMTPRRRRRKADLVPSPRAHHIDEADGGHRCRGTSSRILPSVFRDQADDVCELRPRRAVGAELRDKLTVILKTPANLHRRYVSIAFLREPELALSGPLTKLGEQRRERWNDAFLRKTRAHEGCSCEPRLPLRV